MKCMIGWAWISLFPVLLLLAWAPRHAAAEDLFSATLVDYGGKVRLQKADDETWLPVEMEMPLQRSDRLKTGSEAFCEILVDDGSLLRVEENSEISLKALSASFSSKSIQATLFFWYGRLLANIAPFVHSESRLEVHTQTMAVGVRGTEFVVETISPEQTDVGVFDGSVAVVGLDRRRGRLRDTEVLLRKGYQTSVGRDGRPIRPRALKKRMLAHRKSLERMRKKAIEKRRTLQWIMKRRIQVHEQVLKRWKKLREEKPKTINPRQKIRQDRVRKLRSERIRKWRQETLKREKQKPLQEQRRK